MLGCLTNMLLVYFILFYFSFSKCLRNLPLVNLCMYFFNIEKNQNALRGIFGDIRTSIPNINSIDSLLQISVQHLWNSYFKVITGIIILQNMESLLIYIYRGIANLISHLQRNNHFFLFPSCNFLCILYDFLFYFGKFYFYNLHDFSLFP